MTTFLLFDRRKTGRMKASEAEEEGVIYMRTTSDMLSLKHNQIRRTLIKGQQKAWFPQHALPSCQSPVVRNSRLRLFKAHAREGTEKEMCGILPCLLSDIDQRLCCNHKN